MWTPGAVPLPIEYLELFLCRDVYHCTPTQLNEVPLPKILAHLTALEVEAKMQKGKAKLQQNE